MPSEPLVTNKAPKLRDFISNLAFVVISLSLFTGPTSPVNSEKFGVITSAPLYLEKLSPLGSTNTVFFNFFAFRIIAGIS